MILLQTLWITLGLVSPFLGLGSRLKLVSNWSLNRLFRYYVATGRFTFFATTANSTSIAEIVQKIDIISTTDKCLAVAQFLVLAGNDIQQVFIKYSFGISVITIWVGMRSFTKYLRDYFEEIGKEENIPAKILLSRFQELKKLATSINCVWHHVSFTTVLDVVSWFSTDLDASLKAQEWGERLEVIYIVSNMITYLVLSAETYRQVQINKMIKLKLCKFFGHL